MESSDLVIFSTSGKFIFFNVLRYISLSETLFWTGARARIPITLKWKAGVPAILCSKQIGFNLPELSWQSQQNSYQGKNKMASSFSWE